MFGNLLRKFLLALSALSVLVVIVLSVIAATQRPPLIDGSNAKSEPLHWWSQKLLQGLFDYRVWSGARSGLSPCSPTKVRLSMQRPQAMGM